MFNKILNYYKTELSFKNLFRVSNIFLLIILYITAITSIIFTTFEFSEDFWQKITDQKFSKHRVVIYGVPDRIGEVMIYNRILKTLKLKKIDYIAAKFPEYYINFFITKHFYYIAASLVNYIFQPNFNLAVTHYVTLVPYGYNVVYLNVPNEMLFDKNRKFKKKFSHLKEYDAYLDLYSVTNGGNPILEEAIKCTKCYDNKIRKIIPGYLAQNYIDYQEASFNKLLVTGSLWGCNRNSLRIAVLLSKLEKDDLLVAYGLSEQLDFLKKAYKGNLENVYKDTKAIDSIYKLHNDNGMALVLHNLEHMTEGIPTNRILEAVSSGAMAISDQNLFIKKFFKDSVLYFDAFASADAMYDEIKAHLNWIKNNPEAARKKSKAAYEIFINNFTIEKQIDNLIEHLSL